MCSVSQNEATDTNTELIDPGTGRFRLKDKIIILAGGPVVNAPIHYHEHDRITSVYWKSVNGVNYWCLPNDTMIEGTALSYLEMKQGQDMFVIQSFIENADNKFLVIYGYGWKGTFAGGKFFKFVVYPNIIQYTNSYYIFKWTDNNNDCFVDLSERSKTSIATG
jgi:hypothetical protein